MLVSRLARHCSDSCDEYRYSDLFSGVTAEHIELLAGEKYVLSAYYSGVPRGVIRPMFQRPVWVKSVFSGKPGGRKKLLFIVVMRVSNPPTGLGCKFSFAELLSLEFSPGHSIVKRLRSLPSVVTEQVR